MGVASVSWVVGWGVGPLYLPPPPPTSPPRIPVAPEAYWTLGWRGGGGGGEDQGIVGRTGRGAKLGLFGFLAFFPQFYSVLGGGE